MIFNKELDKGLFLILKNDKKNRKEIVNLIKNLPEDLYKDILKELDNAPADTEFANGKYICKVKNSSIMISNYDRKEDINMELLVSPNDDIGYFSKTISVFDKKKEKKKKKESKYYYSLLSAPKEDMFIKVREKKIINGFPIISDYKEDKIPELTLSYIDNKFNRKK